MRDQRHRYAKIPHPDMRRRRPSRPSCRPFPRLAPRIATRHHGHPLRRRPAATAAVLAIPALAIATPALAQAAPAIEPLDNFLNAILATATGAPARTAGAIAIAWGGYMLWSERWPRSRFLWLLAGIMVVLGAPTIMQWMDQIV